MYFRVTVRVEYPSQTSESLSESDIRVKDLSQIVKSHFRVGISAGRQGWVAGVAEAWQMAILKDDPFFLL